MLRAVVVVPTLMGLLGAESFAGSVEERVAAIARVARTRAREPLPLSFQPEPCTLTAGDATIPLRTVSWSMTKETDGTGDAIVTARCAKAAACVASGTTTSPRFSLRLAASAREARAMLRELKGLPAHCH